MKHHEELEATQLSDAQNPDAEQRWKEYACQHGIPLEPFYSVEDYERDLKPFATEQASKLLNVEVPFPFIRYLVATLNHTILVILLGF